MTKVYAGARALAVVLAIVGAFVTVPQLSVILILLGAISVIGNQPEDNVRVYIVTAALLLGAKELSVVPAVGSYLATIFSGIGLAALGGTALGVLITITRFTTAAFASPKAA